MKNLKNRMILAAAALSISALPSLALAGATCGDVLGGGAFDCTHVNEAGGNYTSCVTFGAVNGNGDVPVTMDEGANTFTGTCSCSAKGNETTPLFDVGSSFSCLTSAVAGDLVIGGKASPGKIKKGFGTTVSGLSSMFSCVQRETACP